MVGRGPVERLDQAWSASRHRFLHVRQRGHNILRRRADGDSLIRQRMPETLHCLKAVTPRRHSHVDKRQGMGEALAESTMGETEPLLFLVREIESKGFSYRQGRRFDEKDARTSERDSLSNEGDKIFRKSS